MCDGFEAADGEAEAEGCGPAGTVGTAAKQASSHLVLATLLPLRSSSLHWVPLLLSPLRTACYLPHGFSHSAFSQAFFHFVGCRTYRGEGAAQAHAGNSSNLLPPWMHPHLNG
ncbi:hypothetical protein BHM03_00052724 [Ensete ventricosum]|nr:hypothetical protein BHM03_00052724 [Ensete ventricosum]